MVAYPCILESLPTDGRNEMNDAIIEAYRALIAAYLAASTIANEDAIEDFEEANPGVVDAYYQREVAKGGSNAYHDFV